MTQTRSSALLLALSMLAACGGGGSSPGGGLVSGSAHALYFSSQAGETLAITGAPFADPTGQLTDLEGRTFEVPMTFYRLDKTTGETTVGTTMADVFIPSGAFAANGVGMSVTVFGQTFTLDNNWMDEVDADTIMFGGLYNRGGHAAWANLFGNDAGPGYDEGFEVTGIVGLETDPATVGAMGGTASYSGYVEYWGNSYRSDGSLDVYGETQDGGIDLDVDFDAGRVTGQVVLTGAYHRDGGGDPVAIETVFGIDTGIEGNGFATGMTVACSTGACTGSADIGGTFYGPDATEAFGITQSSVTYADPSVPGGAQHFDMSGFFRTER